MAAHCRVANGGDTLDGRPGWAQRFVEAGYAVFIVDRPCHGRAPYHPEIVGPMGPPFSYERARAVYLGPGGDETRWPFHPDDQAGWDAFLAAYGPIPADLGLSQAMDADRLARLLDQIGPAIVVTHSASGPVGWVLADRRPGLVAAIVSVEPMGPAFSQTPGFGPLAWGLTAAPVTYDPPRTTPEEVRHADPSTLRIPALTGLPIAVVTGETSTFVEAAPDIVVFLQRAGAAAAFSRRLDRDSCMSSHRPFRSIFADELRAAHDAAAVGYVSAPVFGRPDVASPAQLVIMAAGDPQAVEKVRPLLETIGRKVWVLGADPKQANAAKIAGNMMIALAIEAMAEAAALVESNGLEPATFFELILQTQFGGSRAYQNYSAKILAGDFEPGFRMRLGLKDLRLANDAARRVGAQLPLLEALGGQMEAAVAAGMGERDWSAIADYTRQGRK